MKKLIIISLVGFFIINCQSSDSKRDQDSENKELDEKVTPKKNLNIGETSESEEALEKDKIEETILKNEEKNWEIEKLNYQYLRVKFVGTEEGDLFYYIFKDEKGKEHSFVLINDESYKLLIEDESSNYGLSINPIYKDKYFDIFYQVEKHDLLGWGEKEEYDVVEKMILVEK
jgi:hypothetical protein